jgi:aminoglycoside phosphotransferase (APT) family kinase protein
VAELVREFHDLTAGTPLAGADEVVCHNDLSPRNTVYEDGEALRPVAFIDWDAAAGANAGEPAMVRLRDMGVVRSVRDAWGWVAAHRGELERALR